MAGKSTACCKTCHQLGLFCESAAIARWHTTSCTKSASLTPKMGDFKARARDKSCAGDTSTSNNATTSCTSGMSAKSVFSGCKAAMCRADNSACISPRRSRLRASTITSLGWNAPTANCSANQRAAWRHSRVLRVSSAISRGVVRELRHAPSHSSPSIASFFVAACARSMRSRR